MQGRLNNGMERCWVSLDKYFSGLDSCYQVLNHKLNKLFTKIPLKREFHQVSLRKKILFLHNKIYFAYALGSFVRLVSTLPKNRSYLYMWRGKAWGEPASRAQNNNFNMNWWIWHLNKSKGFNIKNIFLHSISSCNSRTKEVSPPLCSPPHHGLFKSQVADIKIN